MAENLEEYNRVRSAFDNAPAAAKYAVRKNAPDGRNRKEREAIISCIKNSIRTAPRNCLDIPCGAFRLAGVLLDGPFGKLRVTASDYSTAMLEQARLHARTSVPDSRPEFSRQDIMSTSFDAASFDLVICNRLLHHYSSSDTRIRVLRELRRLCRDTVVVSFFDSRSFSNVLRRLKHLSGIKPQTDRYAVSRAQFAREVRSAGLEPVYMAAIHRGFSPQTYAALRPIE